MSKKNPNNKKAPVAPKNAAGKKSKQRSNPKGRNTQRRTNAAGKKSPKSNKTFAPNRERTNSKKPYQQPKIIVLLPVDIKRHGDSNGGHFNAILEDFEDKHVSVGLTTKATKGAHSSRKNYKCEVNPLGGKEQSYMRRQGMVAPKKEYEPIARKGYMSQKDLAQAKIYGEKAKQKYIEKRQQKKQ